MKKIKTLIAMLLISIFTMCSSWGYENVLVLDRTPFAYQRLTVGTGTVFSLNANHLETAGSVFVTVETNNIRYRIDGNDPTVTAGHLVVADAYQNIWLTDAQALRNFRMIGSGGTAIVHITYYRAN